MGRAGSTIFTMRMPLLVTDGSRWLAMARDGWQRLDSERSAEYTMRQVARSMRGALLRRQGAMRLTQDPNALIFRTGRR